jgi:phage tail-like protein
MSIVLLNQERRPVRRHLFYRCWVSEYQALPFLDAGTAATAFEHIKVENEGWERDTTLAEPQEQ